MTPSTLERHITKLLGIEWSDFVTNNEVRDRDRSQQSPVINTIYKLCQNCLGHVSRLHTNVAYRGKG